MKAEHRGWSTVGVSTSEAMVTHCGQQAANRPVGSNLIWSRWRCVQCNEEAPFTSPRQRTQAHVPDAWEQMVDERGDTLTNRDKAVTVRRSVEVLELVRPHSQRYGDEIAIVSWAAEKYADVLDPKPVRRLPRPQGDA